MRILALRWLVAAVAAVFPPMLPGSTARGSDAIEVSSVLLSLLDEVSIPAQEEGVLSAAPTREGDSVKKGETLGQIDDEPIRFAQRRAAIELEMARQTAANDLPVQAAEKAYYVARAELQRAQRSEQEFRGSVSETEMDRLRLSAEQARLRWEQAQRDLKMAALTVQLKENELRFAEASLERRRIKSPVDGLVVEVKRGAGEWVTPGETVFRVVRSDVLRAGGFLEAAHYARVHRGDAVEFVVTTPQGPRRFPGTLTFVSPELDPLHPQMRILAEIPNADGAVQPGMRGSLIIFPQGSR